MTVSTETNHNEYVGNGATTSFPYTFRIFKKSDLVVFTSANDGEDIKILRVDTDYTVTSVGGFRGGNVVLKSPLSSGVQISISRELPATQETSLRNQGKFFPEVHEDAFDKLTMLIQQVRSSFSLALRKPSFLANYYDAVGNYIRNLRDPSRPQDAATKSYVDNQIVGNTENWKNADKKSLRVSDINLQPLPSASERAEKVLSFDRAGHPIVVAPASGSAVDVLNQLARGDGSLVGVHPTGTLKDTMHSVHVQQWSHLVGIDNDWTNAIQAAIDYMSSIGGGKVVMGSGVYRAANLILKPRVVIQGQTKETTMIKAPDNWNGNAVVMWQGYLTYKTDSATQVTPGCFSAGLCNLTIHGNKKNFGGTPSQTIGNGVLAAGANLILDDIKIIYVPSVGLVTLEWGANRAQYQAVDPDRGWAHIGTIRGIRIQFCGNDCWHCEAQDYFLDDVEIVGAGDGFTSDVDTFSFWDADELVSNFRAWRNIDIGFFHSYGNYNGYGFVAGPNTSTFFIRVKYDSLICESCLVGCWFKPSTYVQGVKLDTHEIAQQKPVVKHAGTYPPAVIIESSSPRPSNFSSIEIVQNTNDNAPVSYCGLGLYLGGKYNTVGSYTYSRSPTISDAYAGSGIVFAGDENRVLSAVIKGFFGNDSSGNPSTGINANAGVHYINANVGFGNVGVKLSGGTLHGEIKNISNLAVWQSGLEVMSTYNKSMLKLYSNTNSNHGMVRGAAGAVNTSITTVQTISITGLSLPYVPSPSEVTPHIIIDASNGSSIPPQVDSINYIASLSSVNQLTFLVRLTNTNSPMQTTIGARLN